MFTAAGSAVIDELRGLIPDLPEHLQDLAADAPRRAGLALFPPILRSAGLGHGRAQPPPMQLHVAGQQRLRCYVQPPARTCIASPTKATK